MSPMPALQRQPASEHEALDWFSCLRRPDCTETMRQAFALWCEDPANAHAYAELERYWKQLQPPPARPRPQVLKARRNHAGKCLAGLFLLALTCLSYLYWPLLQRLGSELHTDPGERRTARLADGSTLHLDSASAMNLDLRGRTRQLHLVQGQVYLEVMLDGRPMEVQVDEARIQVFGTRLMIARHAGRDELVVLSGKAMISQASDQRMLSAGERVMFSDRHIDVVEKADPKTALAWRAGHLYAKDQPIKSVLERLAQYQGQRLWLMEGELGHRRVSGDFNLDRPAETLEQLARQHHLKVHDVLGHWLIVH